MTLPKKVREAGEAADAELAALQVKHANPLEAGSVDTGTPAPGTVTPAPATATATPQGDELQIDWKSEAEKAIHKFNVLNGKYTAEVPLLRSEITALTERLKALESGNPAPATTVTPTTTGGEPTFVVPDEIKELYGDDLPKWVTDVAKAAATAAVKPVAAQVETITEQGSADKGQAFYDAINTAHPDWETINGLEAFKSFLATQIPGTGMERQEIINKAQFDKNPEPIIEQIKVFKETYGEQTRLKTSEIPLSTGGGAPLVTDVEGGDQIKESDIQNFYAQASQGKYKSDPKEFKRLEELIKQASLAGTIIMDVTPPSQLN